MAEEPAQAEERCWLPRAALQIPHGGLGIRSSGWKYKLSCGQVCSLRGCEGESVLCLSGSWRLLQSLRSLACSRITAFLFHFCMACSLCACLSNVPFYKETVMLD